MFNATLAMLTRALQVDNRLMRTHLFRLLLLGGIYVFLFSVQSMSVLFGAPGAQLFNQMIFVNCVAIVLSALSYFATAITEEKEEQTLGLLRMANVGPLAILLGKWLPRLVTALILLAMQLPFTLLAITLGGVTLETVVSHYVGMFAFLILLANIGLLFSVVCRRSSKASMLTGITLVLLLCLVPIVSLTFLEMLGGVVPGQSSWFVVAIDFIIRSICLLSYINRLLGLVAPAGLSSSTIQVAGDLVVAALLFLLSWAVFDRCNRDPDAPAPSRMSWSWVRRKNRRLLGVTRTWPVPFVWKEFYLTAGGVTGWIVKLIGYPALVLAILFLGVLVSGNGPDGEEFGLIVMWVVGIVAMIELSISLGQTFRQEIRDRTHDTLLMTPHSIPYIAYSKILGCFLGLLPAAAWFSFGALLDVDDIEHFFDLLFTEIGFAYFILQFPFYFHLVVLFSLYVKWGAAPLALTTVVVGNACLLFFFAMISAVGVSGSAEGLFGLLAFGDVMAFLFIHVWIGRRLRELSV